MNLKQVFESIVGSYTPDYTANDIAQLDIPYIIGCIFLICATIFLLKGIRDILRGVIGRDR